MDPRHSGVRHALAHDGFFYRWGRRVRPEEAFSEDCGEEYAF